MEMTWQEKVPSLTTACIQFQNPHNRREQTPKSCPLTTHGCHGMSIPTPNRHVCAHGQINKSVMKFLKKNQAI